MHHCSVEAMTRQRCDGWLSINCPATHILQSLQEIVPPESSCTRDPLFAVVLCVSSKKLPLDPSSGKTLNGCLSKLVPWLSRALVRRPLSRPSIFLCCGRKRQSRTLFSHKNAGLPSRHTIILRRPSVTARFDVKALKIRSPQTMHANRHFVQPIVVNALSSPEGEGRSAETVC